MLASHSFSTYQQAFFDQVHRDSSPSSADRPTLFRVLHRKALRRRSPKCSANDTHLYFADMPVLNSTSDHTKAVPVTEPDPETFEMDDSTLIANEADPETQQPATKGMLAGVARHTLGLILLLCVVFLWTLSNFLGSVCIADSGRAV